MNKLLSIILVFAVWIPSCALMAEKTCTFQELTLHYTRKSDGHIILRPRTPAGSPIVYQYDHTILFGTTEFCNSVVLIDPYTEEVVYEMQVDATESLVTLPTYLEGEYEIRFMRDTYYYSGIIVL